MKTTIYFVRHAKSDFAVKDDKTRPLTDKGREGAMRVSEFLRDKEIEVLYSSPYLRTMDTLKPFCEYAKKEMILIEELKERVIGCWVEDFDTFSKSQWLDFDYKLANGESLNEVQKRNVGALATILKESKGMNIAIATHGTALSTIINHYDQTFTLNGFESIRHKMPLIVKFVFEDDTFKNFNIIDLY